MVEEGTLDGGPKGGGKEELGDREWVLLNTLSLKKTKIWQDYSTSLELKRREERSFFFFFFGMKEMGGLYSSGGGNMNGRPFNESWQGIMNIELILAFGKICCIKCRDWWEWGARDYTFMQDPMVEKETFGRGPKGGGKEELGDEEWVSLNTLSFSKTKI